MANMQDCQSRGSRFNIRTGQEIQFENSASPEEEIQCLNTRLYVVSSDINEMSECLTKQY